MAGAPLLLDASRACGYLRVGSEELAIEVSRSGLYASPRLRASLVGHEERLLAQVRANVEGGALLAEVQAIAERGVEGSAKEELPPARFYELLVSEIDEVGWAALQSISASLDEVCLRTADAAGREHTIALRLPPDYPRMAPIARTSLPVPFSITWPRDRGTGRCVHSLGGAVGAFRKELERHQVLWDMLDDLDAHAWVRVNLHARHVSAEPGLCPTSLESEVRMFALLA